MKLITITLKHHYMKRFFSGEVQYGANWSVILVRHITLSLHQDDISVH